MCRERQGKTKIAFERTTYTGSFLYIIPHGYADCRNTNKHPASQTNEEKLKAKLHQKDINIEMNAHTQKDISEMNEETI